MWFLDNGCSKHMTGEASQLINLKWKPAGFVTYGDNNRGRIIGVGDTGSENKVIQNEKGCRISTIKSDHGGEFQNERFEKL